VRDDEVGSSTVTGSQGSARKKQLAGAKKHKGSSKEILPGPLPAVTAIGDSGDRNKQPGGSRKPKSCAVTVFSDQLSAIIGSVDSTRREQPAGSRKRKKSAKTFSEQLLAVTGSQGSARMQPLPVAKRHKRSSKCVLTVLLPAVTDSGDSGRKKQPAGSRKRKSSAEIVLSEQLTAVSATGDEGSSEGFSSGLPAATACGDSDRLRSPYLARTPRSSARMALSGLMSAVGANGDPQRKKDDDPKERKISSEAIFSDEAIERCAKRRRVYGTRRTTRLSVAAEGLLPVLISVDETENPLQTNFMAREFKEVPSLILQCTSTIFNKIRIKCYNSLNPLTRGIGLVCPSKV